MAAPAPSKIKDGCGFYRSARHGYISKRNRLIKKTAVIKRGITWRDLGRKTASMAIRFAPSLKANYAADIIFSQHENRFFLKTAVVDNSRPARIPATAVIPRAMAKAPGFCFSVSWDWRGGCPKACCP
jgi:hypothetical protein